MATVKKYRIKKTQKVMRGGRGWFGKSKSKSKINKKQISLPTPNSVKLSTERFEEHKKKYKNIKKNLATQLLSRPTHYSNGNPIKYSSNSLNPSVFRRAEARIDANKSLQYRHSQTSQPSTNSVLFNRGELLALQGNLGNFEKTISHIKPSTEIINMRTPEELRLARRKVLEQARANEMARTGSVSSVSKTGVMYNEERIKAMQELAKKSHNDNTLLRTASAIEDAGKKKKLNTSPYAEV